MKNKFIIASLLFFSSVMMGQVKSVSYQLDYNNSTKHYDVYLVINEGAAHKAKDRIQFNANIGIITPSHVNLEIVKSYMPLVDNLTYNGVKPMKWEVASYLRNLKALRNNAIYSISPKLNNTSSYNDLKEGDKIKLFSLEVYPLPADKSSVKLYSNKKDVSSKMLEGSDFRNGFTLGGVNQLFEEGTELPTYDVPTFDKFSLSSKVYPNPAIDNLHIDINTPSDEQVDVMIYNVDGKLVKKSSINKTSGLFTSSHLVNQLSPGVYTIAIEAMGQRQEHKVIIINE